MKTTKKKKKTYEQNHRSRIRRAANKLLLNNTKNILEEEKNSLLSYSQSSNKVPIENVPKFSNNQCVDSKLLFEYSSKANREIKVDENFFSDKNDEYFSYDSETVCQLSINKTCSTEENNETFFTEQNDNFFHNYDEDSSQFLADNNGANNESLLNGLNDECLSNISDCDGESLNDESDLEYVIDDFETDDGDEDDENDKKTFETVRDFLKNWAKNSNVPFIHIDSLLRGLIQKNKITKHI